MRPLFILLYTLTAICSEFTSSCISSDGAYLAVGNSDGRIAFYLTSTLTEPIWIFRSKYDNSPIIKLVTAKRDGAYYYAAATQNGSLIFFDGLAQKKISELESMGEIQALFVQPALERHFISYSTDGKMWLFDSRTAAYLESRVLPGKPYLKEMDYAPNLKELVYLTIDGSSHFLSSTDLVERAKYSCCGGEANKYAISADTHWIAFSTSKGRVEVLDYGSLEKVRKKRITKVSITALAYKPSTSLLIAGDIGGDLYFWEYESGRLWHRKAHTSAVLGIHYYSEGKMITIAETGECFIWDVGSASIVARYTLSSSKSP